MTKRHTLRAGRTRDFGAVRVRIRKALNFTVSKCCSSALGRGKGLLLPGGSADLDLVPLQGEHEMERQIISA
ncbi:hypothetical protein GCM10010387_04180 [Streptomyces inusitatus]|uniref:Uncharacterized protein n=1 Tax=Streptomyces inusitatus TaxID=68221 RepID=A0A918UJJ1_9ACTN|nr:hypothetical protein GCM10010387_04180 [Streptomyces inusitatus]